MIRRHFTGILKWAFGFVRLLIWRNISCTSSRSGFGGFLAMRFICPLKSGYRSCPPARQRAPLFVQMPDRCHDIPPTLRGNWLPQLIFQAADLSIAFLNFGYHVRTPFVSATLRRRANSLAHMTILVFRLARFARHISHPHPGR